MTASAQEVEGEVEGQSQFKDTRRSGGRTKILFCFLFFSFFFLKGNSENFDPRADPDAIPGLSTMGRWGHDETA